MIERTKSFVVMADEVWRLQRGDDAESKHFQRMANQGHYGGGGGTRQGIYVASADGTLHASVNSLDPKHVIKTLDAGLEAWKKHTGGGPVPAAATGPEPTKLTGAARWEDSFPEGGLVLRSFNRDLGPAADRARWNQDHLWIARDEIKGLLPTPAAVGARRKVDRKLVERLVCFHLVDNVRGQTLPFAPEEIVGATIHAEITKVTETHITLVYWGSTRAQTDGSWKLGENDWKPKQKWPRSVETNLWGEARYQRDYERFESFRLVAIGSRSGRTSMNARRDDHTGSIGFSFSIAPDTPAHRVAPAFVDVYGVDWVKKP